MVAENYTLLVSGTTLGLSAEHAVSLTLLCGVSGTAAIPVQVNSAGQLVTSGA